MGKKKAKRTMKTQMKKMKMTKKKTTTDITNKYKSIHS